MNEISIFQRAGSVSCDFEGIKNTVAATLNQYKGLVFTEETKQEAKKSVAELRKGQKELLDRVKEAKKEFLKPWDEFNDRAMEIAKLFDEPICLINEQIDIFEEKRKKEKADHVKDIYAEMIPDEDIQAYLPLSRVYNVKWENATYTDKQIKDDLFNAKQNVITSVKTIKGFNSDVEDKALKVFAETLSLTDAIKVIQDYEESKKVALANEGARIKEEAKAEAKEEARAEVIDAFIPEVGGEEKAYNYVIFLTDSAKQKLEDFMNSVGIEYMQRG